MKRTLPAIGLFALVVFIIGLNLRPIMAAMGPLYPYLQQNVHLSATRISLLTTLPVIMIQALMPALIKRRFSAKASTLMALFTTGIMAGAALAAVSAAPLATSQGLALTLALPALPALIALLLWRRVLPVSVPVVAAKQPQVINAARAWLLMAFFGMGTAAYTLVLAWLPPFYQQHGWSAEQSGYVLGALTLTEVAAGFLLSALIHRFPDRRLPLLLVLALILSGLICLMTFGGSRPWLPTLLLGLGIGALFPLSLIVTLDHVQTAEQAGTLLSFVQGGGYLLAALMPLIAGVVRDHAASLNIAWLLMSAGMVLLMGIALRFRPGV